jgi:4-hydroxy-tetrahydrodipicolinate synthase
MLTAFDADGGIDWRGVDALVDWYIESGSAGLFAVCLSSEMYCLTSDERLELARRVVRRADGRVPVVATGTFGGEVADQAAFVARMADTGVDAVVAITSQLCGPEDDDPVFEERLMRLLEVTRGVRFGLYECPVPYRRLVPPDVLGRLARTNRFYYLKETSCSPATVSAKVTASRGTPLGVFNAHTPTALEGFALGASGISCIAANLYPEPFSWLWDNRERAGEEASSLQVTLAMMDLIARAGYPASAKSFLRRRGLPIGETCRATPTPVPHDLPLLHRALAHRLAEIAERFGVPVEVQSSWRA